MHMPDLRIGKAGAVGLLALGLLLCATQGVVWWAHFRHIPNESARQNYVIWYPPNDLPGLLGLAILFGDAGALIFKSKPLPQSVEHESLL